MQRHKLILLISLFTSIIVLIWLDIRFNIGLDDLQGTIQSLGILAPILFILIYTLVPIFFMPITPLSIIAGILFGPVLGTFYTVIGATAGACAAFLTSRYLVKDWVDKKSSGKIALIKKRVEEEGWKFIAISRITPVFPFNLQNYIFGATNISLKTFSIATVLSIIPGSFVYVYLGYAGKMAVRNNPSAYNQIIIAFSLIIILAFSPYIIKKTGIFAKD
jgi:uncharacterized membrane protein YdjX (TVP38/TMEM64 family)